MVEVFKTNVTSPAQAEILLVHIHRKLPGCQANFDLADCDRILRIEARGFIDPSTVLALLNELGFAAEVLPDEVIAVSRRLYPVTEYLGMYN